MTEKGQSPVEEAIKESLGAGAEVTGALAEKLYPDKLVDRLTDHAKQAVVRKLVPPQRRHR